MNASAARAAKAEFARTLREELPHLRPDRAQLDALYAVFLAGVAFGIRRSKERVFAAVYGGTERWQTVVNDPDDAPRRPGEPAGAYVARAADAARRRLGSKNGARPPDRDGWREVERRHVDTLPSGVTLWSVLEERTVPELPAPDPLKVTIREVVPGDD